MSTLSFLLRATGLITVLVCFSMACGRWLGRPFRDEDDQPIVNVDQWTAERRAGLAHLNRPAAKGFKHQRATVVDLREHARRIH